MAIEIIIKTKTTYRRTTTTTVYENNNRFDIDFSPCEFELDETPFEEIEMPKLPSQKKNAKELID